MKNVVDLFEKGDTKATLDNVINNLKDEISNMTNDQIISSDIDEWIKYFLAKYQIEPIILYIENVEQEFHETKITSRNPFGGYAGEPEYIKEDGYSVVFHIPFDGDEELLHLRGSSCFLRRFQVDNVTKPSDNGLGKITLSLKYKKNDLEQKEDVKEFVMHGFRSEFRYYEETIKNINLEVEQFNNLLNSIVAEIMQNRKKKADAYISMSEKLNIPLRINPNAPNAAPII